MILIADFCKVKGLLSAGRWGGSDEPQHPAIVVNYFRSERDVEREGPAQWVFGRWNWSTGADEVRAIVEDADGTRTRTEDW